MIRRLLLLSCLCFLGWQGLSAIDTVIGEVTIGADFRVDEKALLKVIDLREGEVFENDRVLAAVDRLRSYMVSQGYYYVEVSYPQIIPADKGNLLISFQLYERINPHVTQVRFTGMRYFSDDKLKQLLLLTTVPNIPLKELERLKERVLNLYLQRSYLFARIEVDSLYRNDTGLTAVIGIDEGKPFSPQNNVFRGNKTTRENTLLAISGLNQAKQITPDVLRRAEANVLRKSYIRSCRIDPVNDNTLLFTVEEGKMTYLEGVLGVNDQAGQTKLSGQVRIRFLNLWGTDRAIRLFWRQLPTQSGELELKYHESGSLRFPLAGDLTLYRSVRDSSWIKMSARAEVYMYHTYHRYGVQLEAESITPGIRRPAVIDRSSNSKTGVFWHYENVDYPPNPTRGTELDLQYRWIWTDDPGVKNVRNALELNAWFYIPISRRLVGAQGTHLRDLNDSNAREYELWTMGGHHSLRGFDEDSFKSWRLGWMNWELRYRITPESRVYLFIDNGIYALDRESYQTGLIGVGLGITMSSRIGMVSVVYGLGAQDGHVPSPGNGFVHLGLDTYF